jgi:hypothetical protein
MKTEICVERTEIPRIGECFYFNQDLTAIYMRINERAKSICTFVNQQNIDDFIIGVDLSCGILCCFTKNKNNLTNLKQIESAKFIRA